MTAVVISEDEIPVARAEAITILLKRLLECPDDVAQGLAESCHEAIADLPEDSRPTSYDGLVDVARFCVEEEPGWSTEEQAKLINGHPRIGAPLVPAAVSEESRKEQARGGGVDEATLRRLAELNAEYEKTFPGLRFVTFVAGRPRSVIADEMDIILNKLAGNERGSATFDHTSEAWKGELERALEALWDIAVDRASRLEPTPPEQAERPGAAEQATVAPAAQPAASEDTKAHATQTTGCTAGADTPAAASAEHRTAPDVPPADDDSQPFLSLSSFRALAVSTPVLTRFFEHDLVNSFRLEPVRRSSSGAAFSWHAAPVPPRGVVPRAVPGTRGPENKASGGPSSIADTLLHGNASSLDADTPASYSHDITTGTRGKVVGFLGGLLGEEGKTRMDALADQVALRLQTHSVSGPQPSFAPPPESPSTPRSALPKWGNALWRGAASAAGAVGSVAGTDRFGGRVAGVRRRTEPASAQADAGGKPPAPAEAPVPEPAPSETQAKRTRLLGSDLATEGPEAAVASLRAADAAIAQDRSTFVIDEVRPPDTARDADDEEGDMVDAIKEVDEGMEVVSNAASTSASAAEGAARAQGLLGGADALRAKGTSSLTPIMMRGYGSDFSAY